VITRQDDYQVRLENFQGPLDLLLFLIRRAEVDVQDVPIAEITDQYLKVLGAVEDVDVELGGEFIVMAATLVEIKSRTLTPPEERTEAGGADAETDSDDPRGDLIRQLMAYQRFRIAADELDARRSEHERRGVARARPGEAPADEADDEADGAEEDGSADDGLLPTLELDDVHVLDLAEAYERIAASIDFSRLGEHTVAFDDTPIELHQADLLDRLGRSEGGTMTLQSAFEGASRAERIGMFLAVLELVRTRRVRVVQDHFDEAIRLEARDDAEPEDGEVAPGDAAADPSADEGTGERGSNPA